LNRWISERKGNEGKSLSFGLKVTTMNFIPHRFPGLHYLLKYFLLALPFSIPEVDRGKGAGREENILRRIYDYRKVEG
jgi:hypothetical protein